MNIEKKLFAVFIVVATGTPAPVYQWRVSMDSGETWSNLGDDASYSGSATATLIVNGTTTAMTSDQFQCVVGKGNSLIRGECKTKS